jgi:hypothetical protein
MCFLLVAGHRQRGVGIRWSATGCTLFGRLKKLGHIIVKEMAVFAFKDEMYVCVCVCVVCVCGVCVCGVCVVWGVCDVWRVCVVCVVWGVCGVCVVCVCVVCVCVCGVCDVCVMCVCDVCV